MRILNLYFSSTGNTSKVAETISETLRQAGHKVDMVKVTGELDIDLLEYELIFAGSGVYEWLPGKAMIELFTKMRRRYVEKGEIKPSSPRRSGRWVVIYCTYGGTHTGINEAIPAIKYMGQLFDHLGYEILAEWAIVGAYLPNKMERFSIEGRLGDIRNRPDEHDLKEVAEKVNGILSCIL